jgi:hypothetical protein
MKDFKLIWGQFSPTAKIPTKRVEDAGDFNDM